MGYSTSDLDSQSQSVTIANDVNTLRDEVKAQADLLAAMEEKLLHIGHPERRYSAMDQYQHTTAPTEGTDGSDPSQDYVSLSVQNTIPEVRECCYADFKNRFKPDGSDGHYAVDVMVSGDLLYQEIRQEHNIREKLSDLPPAPSAQSSKSKLSNKTIKSAAAANDLILQAQTGAKWPRRIRIQSPVLLRALAKVNNERWGPRARTYYRPFHSLIYQHPRMQVLLEEMEARWKLKLNSDSVRDQDEHSDLDTFVNSDAVLDTAGALDCMRAYMRYMEQVIMPDYQGFENLDNTSDVKVRFSDLWHLFRTGELVYRRVTREARGQAEFRVAKRIWKTYFIDPMLERQIPLTADDKEAMYDELDSGNTRFELKCYYIDYNGWEFCVVKKVWSIEPFTGEVPISSLPIYPIRFADRCQERIDQSRRRGQAFLDCLKAKHCSYSGWTLTQSPSGDPILDKNGSDVQQAEHINSDVMIDFGETIQQCPQWKPNKASLREKPVESPNKSELFRIRWQSGPDRAAILGETTELTPGKSGIPQKQRNEFLRNDPFLIKVRENSKHLRPTTEKDLNPECILLLAKRVFAYVFQERKFAPLSVAKIRLTSKTSAALDLLKIPPSIKHTIQGSVQGHLIHKDIERRVDSVCTSLDLIEGKGTGLFILLHGVPGVGKTATAEAIAQANGKPLFKITVGDLGMTPDKLEISLREIFRLASIWDCILLLDEVDTFFSQRSRTDTATNKNALVSVFLRVLDYYNGILFLTTNRAGVLDEAFKSRIHYKFYYPDLTHEQTIDIWKLNIDRFRAIEKQLAQFEKREPLIINDQDLLHFASRLFQNSKGPKEGRWNGRQIRNAFQVARSLAYYEYGMRNEAESRKQSEEASGEVGGEKRRDSVQQQAVSNSLVLDVRHFETMADITASFENYRRTIHGGDTDADLALEGAYRNDTYRDSVTEGLQLEYRNVHLTVPPAADSRMGRQDEAAAGSRHTTPTSEYSMQQLQQQARQHVIADYPSNESGTSSNRHLPATSGPRPRSGSNLSLAEGAPAPMCTDFSASMAGGHHSMRFPPSSPGFGAAHDEAMMSVTPELTANYQVGIAPRTGGGYVPMGFPRTSRPEAPRQSVSGPSSAFSSHVTFPQNHSMDGGAINARDVLPVRGDLSGMHSGRRSRDHHAHAYDSLHRQGSFPFSYRPSLTGDTVGVQEADGWLGGNRVGQGQGPRTAEAQGRAHHLSMQRAETDLSI